MRWYVIVFVLIASLGFSQTASQLAYKFKKELQLMEAQVATSFEISQKFFPQDRTKYMMTLEEFTRLQLLSEYMSNLILDHKISEGTLGDDPDAIPKP